MGDGSAKSRRWRRHWKLLALLFLVVAVLATRLVWGWWVSRQLEAQLAEIRRRGEPGEPADVVYPPLPDSENAWVLQMQAAAALARPANPPPPVDLDERNYPPFDPQWIKQAETSEQSNGPAFALTRQARQRSRVQIRQALPASLAAMMLPYLSAARELANVLADSAVYRHVKGDDDGAIECLLDMMHLARSVRHDDFAIAQISAGGMEAIACHRAMIIGPGLRLEGAAPAREKVRQLIRELLDERLLAPRLRHGMTVDRMQWSEILRQGSAGVWFIRPLGEQEMMRQNARFASALPAVDCDNWPAARAILDACAMQPPGPRDGPRYSRWFQVFNFGNQAVYVERHFRTIAERRATAVALACQLYRADHGQWPRELKELVPAYLPSIPADPFKGEGSLGYVILKGKLPGGGDRPLLSFDYAVGPSDYIADKPMYTWTIDDRPGKRSYNIRQYRDLARFVPPPSKEAVDDDPDKADAPGDEDKQDKKPEQPQAQ